MMLSRSQTFSGGVGFAYDTEIPLLRNEDAPLPKVQPPAAAGAKRTVANPRESDREIANALYFAALRDYGKGDVRSATKKLYQAALLSPRDSDVREALDRMRRETRGVADASAAPSEVGKLPNLADMQRAYDLYFEALKSYSKGDGHGARSLLQSASRLDPSDAGLAVALRRVDQELAGVRR